MMFNKLPRGKMLLFPVAVTKALADQYFLGSLQTRLDLSRAFILNFRQKILI